MKKIVLILMVIALIIPGMLSAASYKTETIIDNVLVSRPDFLQCLHGADTQFQLAITGATVADTFIVVINGINILEPPAVVTGTLKATDELWSFTGGIETLKVNITLASGGTMTGYCFKPEQP